MAKTAILIQARQTSSRFPNKIFASLKGKPVIQHIIDNLKDAPCDVFFVIPNNDQNNDLSNYLATQQIRHHRGNEEDLLKMFYDCATDANISTIIRVCADTPLINLKDILRNLAIFIEEGKKRMVYGNGSWVFSYEMLKLAHLKGQRPEDREHVVRYMFNSIDYPEDIQKVEGL